MNETTSERLLRGVLVARFVRARWGYRFRSRARFEAWQQRRLGAFSRASRRAPFYARTATERAISATETAATATVATATGATATRTTGALATSATGTSASAAGGSAAGDGAVGRWPAGFPVVDKEVLLARFDDLNTAGIRLVDAHDVAVAAERSRDFRPTVGRDITVGLSSGTSGRRGVFLVSPRERMLWAGTVLARVLDRPAVRQLLQPWRPPLQIAFFLRAGGNLYESVASSRVRFTFFDLTEPFDELLTQLAGMGRPDVLVAPASVLEALARSSADGGLPAPRLVVSVAEVLEPEVSEALEAAWGVRPRQVYQATEGLLALSCEAGALHLNEETVLFEREWLDEERTRFVPIVSDLERRTQIVARYRLDDVIRISPSAPERCRCGRVTTVVAGVDGRADSVLKLPSIEGSRTIDVFPDVVRRIMALESSGFADWRVRQRGLDVHVSLCDAEPGASARVADALSEAFDRAGCRAAVVVDDWVPHDPATKARRVVREAP